MVQWLEHSPCTGTGPRVRTVYGWRDFLTVPSVHPAENDYQALFRAGESENVGEEEKQPISATPMLVQVDCLTTTSPHGHRPGDLYLFFIQ